MPSPTPKGRPSSSAKSRGAEPASACWKSLEPNPAFIICRPQIVNTRGRMRKHSWCKLTWGGIHEHSRGQTHSPNDRAEPQILSVGRVSICLCCSGCRGLCHPAPQRSGGHWTSRSGVLGHLHLHVRVLGGCEQGRNNDFRHSPGYKCKLADAD